MQQQGCGEWGAPRKPHPEDPLGGDSVSPDCESLDCQAMEDGFSSVAGGAWRRRGMDVKEAGS